MSDTVMYQPVFNAASTTSSVVNARLQVRSQQLEPDFHEYSASYFDDFEEDEEASDTGTESDDDFDETTLWDIASILKTTNLPSKDSLLPPFRQKEWMEDVINEYDQDSDSGDDFLEPSGKVAQKPVLRLPIQPLSSSRQFSSLLWSPEKRTGTANDWSLVTAANVQVMATAVETWSPPSGYSNSRRSSVPKVVRTSSLEPAALFMTRKPRSIKLPLAILTSNKLWDGCQGNESEHHWISESSVRPESPLAYSTTSSGQSSPSSDASSIRSTSTKASSIWGSISSSMSLSLKQMKKSTPPSPVEDARYPSKLPVKQLKRAVSPVAELRNNSKIPAPLKALSSVRESRVLTHHDLFGEKSLTLDTVASERAQDASEYSTPAASAASWNAGLKSGLSLSKVHLQRPNASVAMWKSALEEAVSASTFLPVSKFDSSVRHPVFCTTNMTSTIKDIHPASNWILHCLHQGTTMVLYRGCIIDTILQSSQRSMGSQEERTRTH